MKILDGYKSYIGAGLGLIVGIGQLVGFIPPEVAEKLYAVATAIFGVGMAGKAQKLADAFTAAAKPAAAIIAVIGLSLLAAPTPVLAADCNFDKGINAKVIRLAWPPSFGINVGVLDFEFGASNYGMNVCQNASVKTLGLICMIPRVDGLLGSFCGEPEE